MLLETTAVISLLNYTKVISGVVSTVGLLFGVFKVIGWVKTKLNTINDTVVDLKKSLEDNFNGLRADIKDQTSVIAGALSEQRQDFRTFYAPTLLLLQQTQAQQSLQQQIPSPVLVPARAKRSRRKPVVKKKK